MLYIFARDATAGDKGVKSATWELSDVLVCASIKSTQGTPPRVISRVERANKKAMATH